MNEKPQLDQLYNVWLCGMAKPVAEGLTWASARARAMAEVRAPRIAQNVVAFIRSANGEHTESFR